MKDIKLLMFIIVGAIIVGYLFANNSFAVNWIEQNEGLYLSFKANEYVEDECVLSFDMENKFNESSLYDFSFNDNYGVLYGVEEKDDGVYGKCYYFDGSVNDNVTVADSSELNLTSWTIMFWYKPNSMVEPRGLLTKGNNFWILQYHGETVRVGFQYDSTNIYADSNASFSTSYFTHVTWVFDTELNDIWVYSNLTLVYYNDDWVWNPDLNDKCLTVGYEPYSNSNAFGRIDEVRVFDYAMSIEEIEGYMNKPIEMVFDVYGFAGDVVLLSFQNGCIWEQQVVSDDFVSFNVFVLDCEGFDMLITVFHGKDIVETCLLTLYVGDCYELVVAQPFSSVIVMGSVASVIIVVGLVFWVKDKFW